MILMMGFLGRQPGFRRLSAAAGRGGSGLRWLLKSPPRLAPPTAVRLAGNLTQSLPRTAWMLEPHYRIFNRSSRLKKQSKHGQNIVEKFFGLFLSITFFVLKFGHILTSMSKIKDTKSFGEHLRHLREEAGLTLKFVSEQITIDTSLLAKIERNERQPTRQMINQVADFFKVDVNELRNHFLSDVIAFKILEEKADLNILKVAEEKVKYLKSVQNGK